MGNLDASRDLHDVRDTVRAYTTIVERGEPGRIYNVCAGQAFRIRDVLDRLVAMSRVPVTVHVDPARYRPSDNPMLAGATEAASSANSAGSRKSRLNQTLATCLTIGERR